MSKVFAVVWLLIHLFTGNTNRKGNFIAAETVKGNKREKEGETER